MPATPPIVEQRDVVRRLEAAGFANAWANEYVGGKDVFVQIAMLLAATERMTFGTSITPMWARPAVVAHAAASQLGEAFPGRFILGLGAGYDFQAAQAGVPYGKPLTQFREYVGRLTEPTTTLRSPPVTYPTILGALGRKALAQAGEIADGALPVLVPPAYVREARAALGPDKLLVVGLTVAIDDDLDAARRAALASIKDVLGYAKSPYANAMRALGYTDHELTTGDRIVDDITAYGSGPRIAAAVERYLEAGADHVTLQVFESDFSAAMRKLESIAPAVTALRR
jgi:probable F420-dependent oxidoreductase